LKNYLKQKPSSLMQRMLML